MTRPDDIDTATLRDLLAKATPPDLWSHDEGEPGLWIGMSTEARQEYDRSQGEAEHLWTNPDYVEFDDDTSPALIAATIAALPALLDVVDNATTQQAALDRVTALCDEKAHHVLVTDLRRALGGDQP